MRLRAAANRYGSATCLAAFCLAGRPPGYGGDRRVGLMQRLRCPGGWITAPGGQRQAMHERPGQRQGDSQQQPHPQAPGEKCPHAQSPFVVPVRCSGALPPLSRANHVPSRLLLQSGMATQVSEHVGFQNGFVRRCDNVPLRPEGSAATLNEQFRRFSGPSAIWYHALAVALSGFGPGEQAKLQGVLAGQRVRSGRRGRSWPAIGGPRQRCRRRPWRRSWACGWRSTGR